VLRRQNALKSIQFACEAVRILAIDDEPLVTRVVSKYLRDEGFEDIRCINDSRIAMSTIDAYQPDLLLLDLEMPHVNGFEIIESISQDPKYEEMIVLVMSAAAKPKKYKSVNLGAVGFIDKPIESKKLISYIRDALRVV